LESSGATFFFDAYPRIYLTYWLMGVLGWKYKIAEILIASGFRPFSLHKPLLLVDSHE